VTAGSRCRVTFRAEQVCERGYGFEQERVYPGVLVGVAAGAELGDGAVVLGLGGELTDACGDGRADGGGGAARGCLASRG